jgi:hypothetical protein
MKLDQLTCEIIYGFGSRLEFTLQRAACNLKVELHTVRTHFPRPCEQGPPDGMMKGYDRFAKNRMEEFDVPDVTNLVKRKDLSKKKDWAAALERYAPRPRSIPMTPISTSSSEVAISR